MSYPIVQASRDLAATGRSIATTLTGVGICIGLLVTRLGMGVPVPIAAPPAMPAAPVAIPGGGHPGGGGHRLLIPADANGSCYVDARVNGVLFNHMLLDSGASGYIALGRNHAAALGLDPDKLSYDHTYSSANGIGHEAIVQLREFRLGTFSLHNVPAAISEGEQDTVIVGVGILHLIDLQLSGGHCQLSLP